MNRKIEITVGLFMLIVLFSALFIIFRVTDSSSYTNNQTYRIFAVFDNVGGLKARSPIKIGGVVIGRVSDITLNSEYKPYATLDIQAQYNKIPSNSALSIKTSGLLGEQFIDVALGMEQSIVDELDQLDALDDINGNIDDNNSLSTSESHANQAEYFSEGFVVHNTKPAIVIEDLIGQLMFSMSASSDNDDEITLLKKE